MSRLGGRLAAVLLAAAALVACGASDGATGSASSAQSGQGTTATTHPADHGSTSAAPAGDLIDPVAFHQDMRKLWEDHVTWTRLYIVSALAGLPDVDATAGRLLQNQADIGDAVATFYGDDAGKALTDLLRQHILIAGDLLTAAKQGDQTAVSAQHDKWYANADDIAHLLADANPAWPFETLRDMMHTHLDQTLAEATARLQSDWPADVAAYDAIHVHILAMADALADGIVAQFPDRFAG